MKDHNIVTLTDSYKFTHAPQYLDGTQAVYSYFEARKGARFDKTVFFGLQYILKEYFEGQVVTREKIDKAVTLSKSHFMNDTIFNQDMWEHILKEHGGRLPVRVRAVPEGMPIPVNNVMMTVENTDPKCFALTNHLETLLTHVWYPSTVASLSRHAKELMKGYLESTSTQMDSLKFQLHDFGMRGAAMMEAAGIGGAGHLVNFFGTDTVVAMETAMEYYDAQLETLAFSIPASEHSVMTSGGPGGEAEIVERLLKTYPVGLVSIVADSYDINNFVTELICKRFKQDILDRNHPDIPCKIIVRPDSLRHEGDTPHQQMCFIAERLWDAFGGTTNDLGYKVLDPHIGMIWGDGIDVDGIVKILTSLKAAGFSAENAVFGMGGGLLQKVNRDTQRFAFKCSAQQRHGLWYDVYKEPRDKSKKSKKGRLKLVKVDDVFYTVPDSDKREDVLETVFEDGEITKTISFDEVRKNAEL